MSCYPFLQQYHKTKSTRLHFLQRAAPLLNSVVVAISLAPLLSFNATWVSDDSASQNGKQSRSQHLSSSIQYSRACEFVTIPCRAA